MALSSNFTTVDQLKIHYTEAGSGDVILLLHGWPTSAYLWRNMLPNLATKYRVIAVDLPGFGKSEKKLDDSYSFRYHARVLTDFLTNLGIEKLSLGVHDLGGPLGLYWAVNNFEKVERLILFNTLVFPEFSNAVKLFGLAIRLPVISSVLTSQWGLKRALLFGVYQKNKLTKEAISQYQAPFKDTVSRKVLCKTIQRLSLKGMIEIGEKLPQFKGPVQIIYGERDKILPNVNKTMERVKVILPQTHILTFPECGHFLQEEEPEALSEAVLNFMEGS
ncbi:MAG: alpha/beta fold hydrolase [Bacteroidota bacterium]